MRFQERFDLPNAIHSRDNEIAIPGTDVSSGRAVTVHLLLARQENETEELLRNIAGLSWERRRQVLDQGDYEGIPYVVTYPLPDDASLRAWISTPEVQRPTQVLRPAGYKTPEPGEFTRLFQARSFEPLLQASAKIEGPPNAPTEAEPKLGEFTALLHSSSDKRENPKTPAVETKPPSVEKPAAERSEPGEFTLMMRSPLAPEAEAPVSKSAPSKTPGEFTRLVRGDLGMDVEAKRDTSPMPIHEPARPSGEFTRMLAKDEPLSDDLFSSAAPAQAPLRSDGFATGAFASRAPSPASPPATGPSEFTRIISSPSASASRSAPAPQTSAAPAELKVQPVSKLRSSYAPLIIILTAVVVVALILIAFFVLQH